MFDTTRSIGSESIGSLRRTSFEVLADAPAGARMGRAAVLDVLESPVGPLIAAADEHALIALEFADGEGFVAQLNRLRARYGGALASGSNRWLDVSREQLQEYFSGTRRLFDVPLVYAGTAFQEAVWSALLAIPYGETWSYGQVADRLGDSKATRAVGMANGSNPLAILIPCHRVVNADRTLGGYGGGAWRKQLLLDLESGQRAFGF